MMMMMMTSSKSKKKNSENDFVETIAETLVDPSNFRMSRFAKEPCWVEIELGVTVSVGDYGNIKPRVSMRIDPDGDRTAQIDAALETAVQAFAAIDGQYDVIISDLISAQSNKPGYRERVDKLEEKVKDTRDVLRKVVDKIRALEDSNSLSAIEKAVLKAVNE